MNVGEERAPAPPVLTFEQTAAIEDAMQQLTQDERSKLARRYEAVTTAGAGNEDPDGSTSDSSDDSSVRSVAPQAGPSRDKGKAVDPRNWGDIDWESDEVDVEAQAAALKQLKKKKKKSKKSSASKPAPPPPVPVSTTPRINSIINGVPRREQSVLPLPSILHAMNPPRAPQRLRDGWDPEIGHAVAAARPSAQIPVQSGLAVALRAAERLNGGSEPSGEKSKKKSDKKRKKKSSDKEYKKAKKAKYNKKRKARRTRRDPSPSDSSSSSESDSSDSSEPDNGNGSRPPRRRVPQRPDADSSPSESSTSSESESSDEDEEDARLSKHILSNMKVFKYDGSQNIRNFVRHVREVVSSLEMNRVPKKYQVEVAARSLEKKAYDYYEQRIANSARSWTIPQMYEALFNHVFPMDYRVNCRTRFNSLTQGGKTVTEFAFEIEELVDLIGEVTEREKVIRLWNGLRGPIQSALWRDRLHPEISTWEQVLDVALYVELSEKPMKKTESSQPRPFDSKRNSHTSRPSRHNRHQNPNSNHNNPSSSSHSNQPASHSNSHRSSEPSKPSRSSNFKKKQSSSKTSSESKMSKKEEEELRAANKCFLCKETGHMKRNCPRANTVKSGSSNRPPGVSNFNVEFADAGGEMEGVLDYLECGAMSIDSEEFDCSDLSDGDNDDLEIRFFPNRYPRRFGRFVKPHLDLDEWPVYRQARLPSPCLGDAHIKVAENILNSSQPYPGDRASLPKGKVLYRRFKFIKEYRDDCLLWDMLLERYYTLEQCELRDPDFTPGDWYACIRQIEAGLPASQTPLNHRRMGDAIGYVAECILRDGAFHKYPSPSGSQIDTEDRFRVQRHSSEFYIITDYVRRSSSKIEAAHLQNPKFNLVRWYELLVLRQRAHWQREVPFNPEPVNWWSPLPFRNEYLSESEDSDESGDDLSDSSSIPSLITVAEKETVAEDTPQCDPPIRLGDPYIERFQETLKHGSPYPGERPLSELTRDEIFALATRFCVRRIGRSKTMFEINDTQLDLKYYAPESFAMDPRSSPGRWYAHKRASELRNSDMEFLAWSLTKVSTHVTMGAVMEEALERKIGEGVPYFQDGALSNPYDECRFCVDPEHSGGRPTETYLVLDRGLDL
ncbi:hypothetical protein H1R20_g14818, partial [Candolleomyces eurysporus]